MERYVEIPPKHKTTVGTYDPCGSVCPIEYVPSLLKVGEIKWHILTVTKKGLYTDRDPLFSPVHSTPTLDSLVNPESTFHL